VGWLADSETDGTEPRGPALLYGVRDEAGHCNCQFEAWLAAQSDEGQRVIGVGGEATRFLGFGRGPVRFGPRLTLGLEHRRRDPDAGLAGFLGVGLEVGTWIGRRALVAVSFDREIGFPADSRNQLQVLFRLARPYGRRPARQYSSPSIRALPRNWRQREVGRDQEHAEDPRGEADPQARGLDDRADVEKGRVQPWRIAAVLDADEAALLHDEDPVDVSGRRRHVERPPGKSRGNGHSLQGGVGDRVDPRTVGPGD
jgi:hypothetical protein